MEELTITLAQIYGIVFLSVGLGMIVDKGFYSHLYKTLTQEPLALLGVMMIYTGLGVFFVSIHNWWDDFLVGLVSLMGWAILLKGILYLIIPGKMIDRIKGFPMNKWLPFASAYCLVLGGIMAWIGFGG